MNQNLILRIFQLALIISTVTFQACTDEHCYYCSDPDICEECTGTEYYLDSENHICVRAGNCPTGTVAMVIDFNICSCDSQCFTCSVTATNCTDCTSAYLYNNECIDYCHDGTYDPIGDSAQSVNGWKCYDCDEQCRTCEVAATNCISCSAEGKYAYNYACVDAEVCESNQMYGDETEKACMQCSTPCQSCSKSALNCTSCLLSYFLEGNACLEECTSPSDFEDSRIEGNPLCTPCDGNCAECHTSPVQCTKCPADQETYLQSSSESCVETCEPGTVKDASDTSNKLCQDCVSPCSECTDTTQTCTRCTEESELFLLGNACVEACEQGQFTNSSDSTNRICSTCTNNCSTCASETECTTCLQSYEFYLTPSKTCELKCPAGTFKNSTTHENKLCSDCTPPCATCETSEITCTTCQENYYFYNTESKCLEACPSGTFVSELNCFDCDIEGSHCAECSEASTKCIQCTQDSETYLYENACVLAADCPVGTYPDSNATDNKQCLPCPQNCSSCTSFTECTSCTAESNYLLHESDCIAECPSGNYPEITDPSNKVCIACNSPCKECSLAPDNCTECTVESNLFVKDNVCVEECGVGYYIDSEVSYQQCRICVAPCVECTSATYCTRCDGSLEQYLHNNECTGTCPVKTYYNSEDATNKVCSDCRLNCAECSGWDVCNKCTDASNLFLWENKCIDACPVGTYLDNSQSDFVCAACVSPCIACLNDSYCLQCSKESDTFLSSNECVGECPSRFFKDSTDPEHPVCSACDAKCSECEGNEFKCLKCVDSLYLYENSCYSPYDCPPTTFANATTEGNGLCSLCNSPCSECSGTADQCTKCIESTNTYLIASAFTCVDELSCPEGYYADSTASADKICKECSSPCKTCHGTANYCLVCTGDSNTYLLDSKCVLSDQCAEGTYADSSDPANKKCSPCVPPCSVCLSASECAKCDEASNLFLVGTQCLSADQCPDGTFADSALLADKKCSECADPCENCVNSADYCLSCTGASSTYLYDGKCLEPANCPKGTFPDETDPAMRICQQCDKNCEECSSAAECLQCTAESGTILFNGQCLLQCTSGYYLTAEKTCQQCSDPCAECYDSADACTKCSDISGLFLLGQSCVNELDCPADYYPYVSEIQGRICEPIDPVNTIYSYRTIAVAAMIAFVIFIYTTMIKI